MMSMDTEMRVTLEDIRVMTDVISRLLAKDLHEPFHRHVVFIQSNKKLFTRSMLAGLRKARTNSYDQKHETSHTAHYIGFGLLGKQFIRLCLP